eukprot:scaffold584_cov338-Pavlova_lutheri.AAC.48
MIEVARVNTTPLRTPDFALCSMGDTTNDHRAVQRSQQQDTVDEYTDKATWKCESILKVLSCALISPQGKLVKRAAWGQIVNCQALISHDSGQRMRHPLC